MRYVVPAGPNIRMMFRDALAADARIMALLADDANSILPRSGVNPAKAKRRFLLVRLEGTGSLGDDNLDRAVWVVEAHDTPGAGYAGIDEIISLLKVRFHGTRWATPTDSIDRPRRSEWAGAGGETVDEGYSTIKRVGRIALIQS